MRIIEKRFVFEIIKEKKEEKNHIIEIRLKKKYFFKDHFEKSFIISNF